MVKKDGGASGVLFSTTFDYREWGREAHLIADLPYNAPAPHSLLQELEFALRVYRESFRCEAMLLDSSNGTLYPDLLACALMAFTPRKKRPRIALAGDMWQPNSGIRGGVEKLIVRLADRVIGRYLVLSSEDLSVFPELWGLNGKKTRLLPFFFSFSEQDLAPPEPDPENIIFAGGNAHRDYLPLVDAARNLPDRQFVFATNRLAHAGDLPPNVKAGPVDHREFVRLMRSSEIVIVPITQNLRRSAGQQTYLNSMYLKKPTVVSRAFGVGDHIEHMVDALVVDGSARSYLDAIHWLTAPENSNQVKAMRERAHEKVAGQFTVSRYIENATRLMKEFLAD